MRRPLFVKTDKFVRGGYARNTGMGCRIAKVTDVFPDEDGGYELVVLAPLGYTNRGKFKYNTQSRIVLLTSTPWKPSGRFYDIAIDGSPYQWYAPCKPLFYNPANELKDKDDNE